MLAWVLAMGCGIGAGGGTLLADEAVATLVEVDGDVSLKRAGAEDYDFADGGEELRLGDFLSTDVDSEALLSFPNGAEVRVFELSQIRINEMFLSPDGSKLQVYLRTGTVETVAPPETLIRSDFSIKTPAATASIRGSVQKVGHTDGLGTRVTFSKGHGQTEDNSGRKTSQKKGQTTQSTSKGGLSGATSTSLSGSKQDLSPPGRTPGEKKSMIQGTGLGTGTPRDSTQPDGLQQTATGTAAAPARVIVNIRRVP